MQKAENSGASTLSSDSKNPAYKEPLFPSFSLHPGPRVTRRREGGTIRAGRLGLEWWRVGVVGIPILVVPSGDCNQCKQLSEILKPKALL